MKSRKYIGGDGKKKLMMRQIPQGVQSGVIEIKNYFDRLFIYECFVRQV